MTNVYDQRYQQVFGNQYNAARDIIFQITPPVSAFEKLWLNLAGTWARALPYRQIIFDRIKTDVRDEQDFPAVAILRHIGGTADGLFNFPEFTAMLSSRYGRLSSNDREDFNRGYQVIQLICMVGFLGLLGGVERATATFAASSTPNYFKPPVLAELANATRLTREDISGRNVMTVYAEILSQASSRYGNEGVLTSRDTFMVYSRIWEEYHFGRIQ